MTREEAIKFLKLDLEMEDRGKCLISDAIDMAIKALEQEPTPKNDVPENNVGKIDCISREDARKAIIEYQYSDGFCEEHNIDHSINTSMALIALSDLPSVTPQEPHSFKWCTDCKEYDQEKHCCHRYSKVIRDTVAEIEQEPRWIPVSERLPEDLKPVNITWVNHEPEPYYHDIKDKNFVATGIHYRGRWYWYSTTCADYLGEYGSNDIDKVDDAVEIVAWMPLPAPYEPQESEA